MCTDSLIIRKGGGQYGQKIRTILFRRNDGTAAGYGQCHRPGGRATARAWAWRIYAVWKRNGEATAFEDRVYRNSYTGVGEAISAALKGQHEGEICLVVADRNGIPQLKITIDGELTTQYHRGAVSLEQVSPGHGTEYMRQTEEMEQLRGSRTTARSAGRPDLTIYPTLFLENTSFDKLYRYAVALAPTLEMPLWKGAELTAQVIVPVATNQKGELKQVRPGFVTLRQSFYRNGTGGAGYGGTV